MHAGRRYSGHYNIFDLKGFSYPVYCDLTSEPKAAWTLFMSGRTPSATGTGLFSRVPLFVDKPTSQLNPNWNAFRLSLSHMKQLRSRSSHWRITCSFQNDGLVLQDYVRAKVVDFDPIDFKGKGICKKVEYINVRGHNCSDCNTAWWQGDDVPLSHDSSKARCGLIRVLEQWSLKMTLDSTNTQIQHFAAHCLVENRPLITGSDHIWNQYKLLPFLLTIEKEMSWIERQAQNRPVFM